MNQVMSRSFVAFSLLVLISPVVHAQTTFGWNFGTTTGTLNSTSGSNPLITVSAVSVVNSTAGTDLSTTTPSSGYAGASGAFNEGFGATAGGLNVNTSSYLRITVTPAAGYAIRLNDLDFGVRSSAILNGAQNYAIRTSIAGFGSAITGGSGTIAQDGTWSLKNNTFTPITGAVNTPVELRLYAYNGSAFGFLADTRIDDINASLTPVPEPATILGLSAIGMFGIGAIRRRFKK